MILQRHRQLRKDNRHCRGRRKESRHHGSLARRREPRGRCGIRGERTLQPGWPRRKPYAPHRSLLAHDENHGIHPNSYFVSPEVASAIFGKQWPELLAAAKTGSAAPITGKVSGLEFNKGTEEIKSSNVLGILPGTDLKDEYVFVTAHYDHVGIINGQIHPGADDDGSGTVSVIAMADAFMKAKKAGKGPAGASCS